MVKRVLPKIYEASAVVFNRYKITELQFGDRPYIHFRRESRLSPCGIGGRSCVSDEMDMFNAMIQSLLHPSDGHETSCDQRKHGKTHAKTCQTCVKRALTRNTHALARNTDRTGAPWMYPERTHRGHLRSEPGTVLRRRSTGMSVRSSEGMPFGAKAQLPSLAAEGHGSSMASELLQSVPCSTVPPLPFHVLL